MSREKQRSLERRIEAELYAHLESLGFCVFTCGGERIMGVGEVSYSVEKTEDGGQRFTIYPEVGEPRELSVTAIAQHLAAEFA